MKTFAWVVCLFEAVVAVYGQFGGGAGQVRNPSIETTGGITYLKVTYDWMCPEELRKKTPVVAGTNVSQSVFLFRAPLSCPAIFPPVGGTDEATVVLGRFAPGQYICHVYTDPYGPGNGTLPAQTGSLPSARIPFTVPNSSTISLIPASAGQIVIRTDGTSNVSYRVQSSSNLTNWTTLHTANGAPFMFTNQPVPTTFYRAQISDGVRLYP
jgi:hypothetical protein